MYIFHLITESLIRDKKMKPFKITSLIKLHTHRELDQLVVYELHHTFFRHLHRSLSDSPICVPVKNIDKRVG